MSDTTSDPSGTPDDPVETIRELLRNAAENGYDLSTWTDTEVAEDIVQCTGEFAEMDAFELAQLVGLARGRVP